MKYIILLLLIIGSFTVAADMLDLGNGTFYNNETGGYYYELEPQADKNIISHTYTPNGERIDYDDGTINQIIYANQIYADSHGTKLEDAYSLMNSEYPAQLNVFADKDFPVKIIDFNLTSITIIPQLTDGNINKNIPLRVINIKSKTINTSILVTGDKQGDTIEVKLPFGFDMSIRYGYNSTIINLTGGTALNFEDVNPYMGFQVKFNMSSIPPQANITSATYSLYLSTCPDVPCSDYSDNEMTLSRIDNQTWTAASNVADINAQAETNVSIQQFSNVFETWSYINVTNITIVNHKLYNKNLTIRSTNPDFPVGEIVGLGIPLDFGDQIAGVITFSNPKLNITYIATMDISNGIHNNTYYNYTDGVIYSNSSAGNGSYTSTVFALNGAYNQLNITASTESQAGYQVQGSVRTKNFSWLQDLLLYYDFDGDSLINTTTIRDLTGSFHGALMAQGIINLTGKFDNSLDTKGQDSYSSVKSINTITRNFTSLTACMWIYAYTSTAYKPVFDISAGNLRLNTGVGNKISFEGIGINCDAYNANDYDINTWQHVCIKLNSTGCYGYNNGTLTASDTSILYGGINISGEYIFVGRDKNSGSFSGKIDEVMFWNRSLSDAEIQQLYAWTSWQPYATYQSFSSSIDTHNYSITNTSTFAQAKFLMFSNSTYNTKLYGFNWTGWNFYGEAEEPTGVCACGTPASCITQWTWNMSCNCNITTPYYCPSTYLNLDTSLGTWQINTTITARFDFINGTTGQTITGNRSGWLNTS